MQSLLSQYPTLALLQDAVNNRERGSLARLSPNIFWKPFLGAHF